MKNLISKYRSLSFEERTLFNTMFSIMLNILLALIKFILAIVFRDVFFFVAGVFNIFVLISKLSCYLGVKYPHLKSFKFHNNMIGIFLFLAGFQYGIYMTRLVFHDATSMNYDMILGIMIALVSFIEMGFAIKGCFNSFGKGHFYRNIKLINLCSAFTAMVLTEMAIMSFASDMDHRLLSGMFGMAVSVIIELIAIYVFFAPYISLVDRKHNVYVLKEGNTKLDKEELIIPLTNSKYYGNYVYEGKVKENSIDGYLVKKRSPLFNLNIYIKIFIIVLSEILIFPYAFGALIFHFKCSSLIKKLDTKLLELWYIKVKEEE